MTHDPDDDGRKDSGRYRVPPAQVRRCVPASWRSGPTRWRFAPVVCPNRAV